MISDEVEERMQTTNFMRQHVRGARQKVLMEQMLKDPAVRIHYASKYASSANYWKNAIGMNEGLVRLNVLDTKRAQQEELLARGREKGDDSYQKAFDEIRSIVAHRRDAIYHQQAINEALVTALDFMRIPSTMELVAALKSKDKEQIKEAKLKLKQEADKYFASVPSRSRANGCQRDAENLCQLHSGGTTNQHLRNHQFPLQGKYRCLRRCML